MVKKLQKFSAKKSPDTTTANPMAGAVKESAQQIWLAGLGAFSKAQQEGTKAFEGLVKEGLSVQRKTQAVAEDRIAEATSRMSSMANDITSKASGQWDKLESIFEDRVARTLNKLGVPSSQDIDALIARIDELNRNVAKLQPKPITKVATAKSPSLTTAAPAAKRPAAKKAAATAAPVAAKRAVAKKPVKAAKPALADAAPTSTAAAAA